MNRPWRVDDYIAQLPRYGKKNYPWIGTTGAGQNCPERESESPGEDIIIEDSVLVLGSNSLFCFFGFKSDSRSLSPLLVHPWYAQRYSKYIYIYESTELEPSVSEPRHPFICLFCQTVLSVKKVASKQAVPESEACTSSKTSSCRPSQRPGRGAATPPFSAWESETAACNRSIYPTSPCPCLFLFLLSSFFQLLSDGAVEKAANSWPAT